jgi:hypothetical protein
MLCSANAAARSTASIVSGATYPFVMLSISTIDRLSLSSRRSRPVDSGNRLTSIKAFL